MAQQIKIKDKTITVEDGEYVLYEAIKCLTEKIEGLRLAMNG